MLSPTKNIYAKYSPFIVKMHFQSCNLLPNLMIQPFITNTNIGYGHMMNGVHSHDFDP